MFQGIPEGPIRLWRSLSALVLAALTVVTLTGPAAAASQGVAVVAINGTYRDLAPLNPGGAADRLSGALSAAGFTVTVLKNPTTGELLSTLRKLTLAPNPDGAAVFYFAGYARQLRERNFIVSRNAQPFTPFDFMTQGVDLNSVISALVTAGGRQQLVVLDGAYPEARLDALAGLKPGLAAIAPPPRAAVVLGAMPGERLSGTGGIPQLANAFAEALAQPRRGTGDIVADFVSLAARTASRRLHVAFGTEATQPLVIEATAPAPAPEPAERPQPQTPTVQIQPAPQTPAPQTPAPQTPAPTHPVVPLISAEQFEATLVQEDRETVQRALQTLGLYGYAIDGDFGPLTRRAITTFQRLRGFEATGVLSAEQMALLLQLSGL